MNPFFGKEVIIHFVNVETDPRLQYIYIYIYVTKKTFKKSNV